MSRSGITKHLQLIIILFGIASMFAGCGGGGGGAPVDNTPVVPASSISITKPLSGENMSDAIFQGSSFVVELAYNDTVPINMSTLSVTLKMDSSAAVSISDHFARVAGTNKIISSNLSDHTQTFFTTNTTPLRTMTIHVSVNNTNGGAASAQLSFSVYPVGQPPNVPPSSVTITKPANGDRIEDRIFCPDTSYTIEMKYNDTVDIDMATLSVLMSKDDGTPVDITNYFTLVDPKTIRSVNKDEMMRLNFFQYQANDKTFKMTLSVTVKNINGGIGSNTISFTIFPTPPPDGQPGG